MNVDRSKSPGLLLHTAKPGNGDCERNQINCAGGKEYAAPTDQVTNNASARSAQQIAAHRRKQQPSDRDLPLLHRNAITRHSQCNREHAAGGDTGDNAERHERFEIRDEAAGDRRNSDNQHTKRDQPRLAEHVGQSAQAPVGSAHRAR